VKKFEKTRKYPHQAERKGTFMAQVNWGRLVQLLEATEFHPKEVPVESRRSRRASP
jgi:hypothetical protein